MQQRTTRSTRFDGSNAGFLRVVLALWLLALSVAATAQPAVSSDIDGPVPAAKIRYLVGDAAPVDGATLADTVDRLPWQALGRTGANLGFDLRPHWFRLDVVNTTANYQQRYLSIANPLLDDVRIYLVANGRPAGYWRFGDDQPFVERPVNSRYFIVPIELLPRDRVSIVVRLQTAGAVQLPLALYHGRTLMARTESASLAFGVYYGLLAVIFFYNLTALLSTRESSYLYYLLHIVGFAVLFASIDGLGFQYLWPSVTGITQRVLLLSLAGTSLFGTLFAYRFLDIDAARAWLRHGFRALLWLLTAATAIAAVAPYRDALQPLQALLMLTIGLTFMAGVLRWRDGHSAGMMLTIAWGVLLVGSLVTVIQKAGLIERTPLTEHLFRVGSAVDLLLLSLALINRMNYERRRRQQAQNEALEHERQATLSRQHALEVQRRATEELEERVRERTDELQRLNEKLRRLSTTDPLTRVRNRRYFNERYYYEFSRARRQQLPIAVLLIDIDHFKQVNDRHGHAVGDEVLKAVAGDITAEVRRDTDVVARYGGEEFAVMLPGTAAEQAMALAERIRERIDRCGYCGTVTGSTIDCSISVGVAVTQPVASDRADELMKQADIALYQAKTDGRNRTRLFSGPAGASERLRDSH